MAACDETLVEHVIACFHIKQTILSIQKYKSNLKK
jgi:hypothetical protein